MKTWLLFVTICLIPALSGCGGEPAAMSGDDACFASRAFIRELLKSPSSAKFASCDTATIQEVGTDVWKVDSYVESQNSFGAMIRTDFTCTIRHDPSAKMWYKENAALME
jgi:hypothetical protein